MLLVFRYSKKKLKRDNWLNFEFFLATELGKTLEELRKSITQEELIYWAGYYENKFDEEKKAVQRQKHN